MSHAGRPLKVPLGIPATLGSGRSDRDRGPEGLRRPYGLVSHTGGRVLSTK